jgi:tyrosine-protein kinase Etk/Wzc
MARVTLATVAATAIYVVVAPTWYRASVTVVPAKTPRSALSGQDLGGENASRIAAVLESSAVVDGLIEALDLRERYGKRTREDAEEAFWSHCDVGTLPKANLVRITCEDRDPAFLQRMLGLFAAYGNRVFLQLSAGAAAEEVVSSKRRVAELQAQNQEAAGRLLAFQEQHRLVDLDLQAGAVVASAAGLQRRRLGKELELGYLQTFSRRDEATVRGLAQQVASLDGAIDRLEATPAQVPERQERMDPSLFPPASAVPGVRVELERLDRDRRASEVALIAALERLEGAAASAARETSSFQLIDPPTLATRPARPHRLLLMLLAPLLGALCAAAGEACAAALAPGGRVHGR